MSLPPSNVALAGAMLAASAAVALDRQDQDVVILASPSMRSAELLSAVGQLAAIGITAVVLTDANALIKAKAAANRQALEKMRAVSDDFVRPRAKAGKYQDGAKLREIRAQKGSGRPVPPHGSGP